MRLVIRALWAGLVVLGLPAVGGAQPSTTFLEVTATNAQGTATHTVLTQDVFFGTVGIDPDNWQHSTGTIQLLDGLNQIAAIDINLQAGPTGAGAFQRIAMGWDVFAGSSDTVFTITSTVLNFQTANDQSGFVTGGLQIGDQNGDGATFTGQYAGQDAFLYQYNGAVPTGTTLLQAVQPFSAGANATNDPGPYGTPGFVAVAGGLSNMSLQTNFDLTAGDNANGTTTYVWTVPEPGTMGLLLLGGVILIGRRRSVV